MSHIEIPSSEYVAQIEQEAKRVAGSPDYLDPEGYISQNTWGMLVQAGLLEAALHRRDPKNYRPEKMEIIRRTSRIDPQLGLMYGIMTALIIDNLYKFGTPDQIHKYFEKIRKGQLYGLGFTDENKSGSSIDMESNFTKSYLTFSKRFQGISGYDLLVFALQENNPAILGLFVVAQRDITSEIIHTEGLRRIRYALNSGHVPMSQVDQIVILNTRRDLARIQQIFTDSRLGFPGMSLGQLELLERLAREYSENRLIGTTLQKDMAVPQRELESITARRIIIQAIY
ncbi:MAG: hypothetical protein AAB909_04600, partial [Patescibacteria group bacterium]